MDVGECHETDPHKPTQWWNLPQMILAMDRTAFLHFFLLEDKAYISLSY